jgi:16S rRNA (adenine(1408)-N(1))-methyltransferase
MRVIKGNKDLEMGQEDFKKLVDGYKRLEIDLGTGDGRYVFKKAHEDAKTLYLGIDPAAKQLKKYSRKAVRQGVENALFVVGSAEDLPNIPEGRANKLNIILPWGSLLDYVANFDSEIVGKIKKLVKPGGRLRIIFGYAPEREPSETERLNLEKLNETYIKEKLIPLYAENGFELEEYKELDQAELGQIETSWSRKLSYGQPRPMFLLKFKI